MKLGRLPNRPPRPPLLTLDAVIRCPDQAKTIALELDPENTTIATVRSLVADEIKAEWRALGSRVLRDTLPAARVMLKWDDRELGMEETLIDCGIKDDLQIEATVKPTNKEARLMQARTRKGEEMEKRRKVRKTVGKQKARKKSKGVIDLPRKEVENETEVEEARKAGEPFADKISELDEEIPVMEDVQRVMEEQDQQDLAEARQVGLFQIGVESDQEFVVEAAEENPFDEEDADKENWNPQILRNVGGDRGGPRVA